jgi:Cu/Ag efflux protein CusF
MNKILTLTLAAALSLGSAAVVMAAEYTKGVVKKVDEKASKVTIRHEELKNLDMPAMTMVFAVPDKSTLGKLKQGEQIEFVAERVKGKLTVTEVK